MNTLLNSLNVEVSYPHVLPLEVIHEVSDPLFPLYFYAHDCRVYVSGTSKTFHR